MTLAPTTVRIVEGAAREFGEIDLIARLGHGGMAEVFLASRRSKPAELLVLKRLKADLDDPEHRAMFDDEARVMGMLAHPNIVRTVDAGEEAGQKYLALEFLDGLPLDQCGSAVTSLGERAALHVAAELLEGLHYAHELHDREGRPLELVHRDVSPHNVFITYEGRVTLVDFGIAKSNARANHTATGVVRGKLSYMAPEQALCDTLDRRADVFAVGVILWELLSGKRYWEGLSDVQILKRMTFGDLPKIREAAPNIREPIAEALDQALAAKPEERFSTARAFREALADSFGGPFKRLELGRAVSEVARGYREALQTVVEGHLSAARNTEGLFDPRTTGEGAVAVSSPAEGAVAADAPSLEPARAEGARRETVDSTSSSAEAETTSPGALSSASVAELADEPSFDSQPSRRQARYAGFETTGGSSLEVSAPVGGSSLRWLGYVAAAVLVVGGAAIAVPRLMAPPPAPAPATVSPLAAPPIEARVGVKLKTVPTDAAVYLDSARIAELPFSASFQRDQLGHALRVEAPGYKTKMQVLVFDRDIDLEIVLEPEAANAPSSAAPPPSAQPPRSSGVVRHPVEPPTSAKKPQPSGSAGFYKGDPWNLPGAGKNPK